MELAHIRHERTLRSQNRPRPNQSRQEQSQTRPTGTKTQTGPRRFHLRRTPHKAASGAGLCCASATAATPPQPSTSQHIAECPRPLWPAPHSFCCVGSTELICNLHDAIINYDKPAAENFCSCPSLQVDAAYAQSCFSKCTSRTQNRLQNDIKWCCRLSAFRSIHLVQCLWLPPNLEV